MNLETKAKSNDICEVCKKEDRTTSFNLMAINKDIPLCDGCRENIDKAQAMLEHALDNTKEGSTEIMEASLRLRPLTNIILNRFEEELEKNEGQRKESG